MTDVKLEPCPFCGGEAELHSTFWGLQPQVSCQCGAKVWEHSEAEAIAAWNTRTAAQPEREAVLEERHDGREFREGDKVHKASGYRWPGEVVAVFKTRAGKTRIVVECTVPEVAGALHIYSPEQLELEG